MRKMVHTFYQNTLNRIRKQQQLLVVLILLSCAGNSVHAQIVTIPDPAFVAFLQTNYPSCMTGNQMDTQCPDILAEDGLHVGGLGISDLTGVEHFINLYGLQCFNNLLTSLPVLPANLVNLGAGSNLLTSLPVLPNSLNLLDIRDNDITSIAAFPGGLEYILLDDNPNLQCLPALPDSLIGTIFDGSSLVPGIFFMGTNITCIPNLPGTTFNTGNYPICAPGDLVNNPGGCLSYGGIFGKIYQDNTPNCTYDSGEPGVGGAKLILLDDIGTQVGMTYSAADGSYQFVALLDGDYTVLLDTAGFWYDVTCTNPGVDSMVSLVSSVSVTGIDFSVQCAPGMDAGVQSISVSGLVFPGVQHTVNVYAGDAFEIANMTCPSSTGAGEIIVTFNGLATYVGPAVSALVPTSVAGNVLTYAIPDLSAIDPLSDIRFVLEMATTATAGDLVCIDAEVVSFSGDTYPANNTYSDCYAVVNSYDPNMKTAYPSQVLPGYSDWITYTIHFQNTGNAPAMNIVLRDTLDALLDETSFELLASDHSVSTGLYGDRLTFTFNDIMLPDSLSDPEGSKGFVQYRIKPNAGLPDGTIIENKAYIFFDYNAPIITNTATTEFMEDLGTTENRISQLTIYPNPSNGLFTISVDGNAAETNSITVYDLAGKVVFQKDGNGPQQVDLSGEDNGIYFVVLTNTDGVFTSKLLKQ